MDTILSHQYHRKSQGCVDEHPRCPEWARAGHCVTYPNTKLMAVTCRESCGVCGFLSPFSREEQVSNRHRG